MDSKADKDYWDWCWSSEPIPRPVDLSDTRIRNHLRQSLHAYFADAFSRAAVDTQGAELIEIGCSRSIWLPHFAKLFHFRVSGIDYSEVGCAQARQMFDAHNNDNIGALVCGNAFDVRADLVGALTCCFPMVSSNISRRRRMPFEACRATSAPAAL